MRVFRRVMLGGGIDIDIVPDTQKLYYKATAKVTPKSSSLGSPVIANKWDATTGEGIIACSRDITIIDNDAFSGESALTSITIPDGITSIGKSAFYVCISLTSVYITDLSAWCKIAFSNSYSNPCYYGEKLYLNGSELTELTIPSDITKIGSYAFIGCSSLTSVTIPNSVTSIGEETFRYCSSLTSVTIPDTLRSIGSYAFKDCEDLKEVHISDLSKWCDISYYHTNDTFPTFIGSPLMYGAKLYLNGSEVTDLVIPDDVTTIKAACFYGCSSITSVTIGSNLRQLGAGAFSDCENLHSVNLEHAENLAYIYDLAFSGSAITTISFPDAVSTIAYAVCSGCRSLISVIFPRNVDTIEQIAFSECESAQYYDFSKAEKVPKVDTTSFRGNPSSIKIIVPDALYSSWKNATNWSALADKIIKKSDWDASQTTE